MENNNSKNLVIGLAVAAGIFLIAAIYVFVDGKSTADALASEKAALQTELAALNSKYDKALSENTEMTASLKAAKAEIAALSDSIASITEANARKIKFYKGRVGSLNKKNKELVAVVDSLKVQNAELTMGLEVAAATIEEQAQANAELTALAAELGEKVALGSMLNVTEVKVEAVKSLSSGELKATNRFKKVEAFRVSFTIAQNLIAEPGERPAFFVVKDASGAVVAPAGTVDMEGTELSYTSDMLVNFENNELEAISLINIQKDVLAKGTYTVEVYFEGMMAGSGQVELKSAVLGIF